MLVEIIDISDDDEEINWDLLQRESDEEEWASTATVGKKREEALTVSPSVSSSSSNISGASYCVSFRGSRPRMRYIRSSMRRPCRDP